MLLQVETVVLPMNINEKSYTIIANGMTKLGQFLILERKLIFTRCHKFVSQTMRIYMYFLVENMGQMMRENKGLLSSLFR